MSLLAAALAAVSNESFDELPLPGADQSLPAFDPGEVQKIGDDLDTHFQVAKSLESIQTILTNNPNGISAQCADFLRVGVNAQLTRIGMEHYTLVASYESFEGHEAKQSTQASLESVKEVAAKVWEKIKALFKTLFEKFSQFRIMTKQRLARINGSADKIGEIIKQVQDWRAGTVEMSAEQIRYLSLSGGESDIDPSKIEQALSQSVAALQAFADDGYNVQAADVLRDSVLLTVKSRDNDDLHDVSVRMNAEVVRIIKSMKTHEGHSVIGGFSFRRKTVDFYGGEDDHFAINAAYTLHHHAEKLTKAAIIEGHVYLGKDQAAAAGSVRKPNAQQADAIHKTLGQFADPLEKIGRHVDKIKDIAKPFANWQFDNQSSDATYRHAVSSVTYGLVTQMSILLNRVIYLESALLKHCDHVASTLLHYLQQSAKA